MVPALQGENSRFRREENTVSATGAIKIICFAVFKSEKIVMVVVFGNDLFQKPIVLLSYFNFDIF